MIDRIHAMAKGQPSMPVFSDQSGNPISDVSPEYFEENNPTKDDEISGVDLDGEVWHKITGVDLADNEIMDAIE